MARHRKDYKSFKRGQKGHTRSFDIFNEYGIDTCKIEWIEDYPCNTKKELEAREGFYIQNLECANRNVMGRTPKEYREQNIDSVKAYKQQWYENNRGIILDKAKEEPDVKEICVCGSTYWMKRKYIHEQRVKHCKYIQALQNTTPKPQPMTKDERNEKRKEKHICLCGSTYRKSDKAKHERTQKHQHYLKQQVANKEE